MPRTKPTIGQRVRAARLATGMTQAELAERIGSRQERITEIERDVYEAPSFARLCAIADALGISVDELRP